MQKGFASVYLLVGILILATVAGGIYIINGIPTKPAATSSPTSYPSPAPTKADETANSDLIGANWKTYLNTKYQFSFKHPPTWIVTSNERANMISETLIKGPNEIIITFTSGPPGVGGACNDDPNADLGNEPISMFGKPLNLFYEGDLKRNKITAAYAIEMEIPCSNIAFFDIPAVKELDGDLFDARLGSIGIYYGNRIPKEAVEFKSEELETAKQILQTFKFTGQTQTAGEINQGRDIKRKVDIQGIYAALVMFKEDKNRYPNALRDLNLGETKYITAIPVDPATNEEYTYSVLDNGQRFLLSATLSDGRLFQVKNP